MLKHNRYTIFKTISKCLIVFLLAQTKTIYCQDTAKYFSFFSTEVIKEDSDLKQLAPYFKGVKVVGMGESTHGTHEFSTMRQRMFKYLVENHHFNTFFLEADYANCLRVNAFIHGEEDNARDAVKEINMWPWKTTEMVDLINWMREYNEKNSNQLNFIGVDLQQYVETIRQMDKILKKYKLPITDKITYQKMLDTNFFLITDIKTLATYKKVVDEKKQIDLISLNAEDDKIYTTLLRHLIQIINSKNNDYRDKKMAENIIYHLDIDSTSKGLFWAHNGHVSNIYKKTKKEGKWNGFTGGNLKHLISDKYFSIGQEFYQGSFNAYYPDSTSTHTISGVGYTLGVVKVNPAIENSFSYKYKDIINPIFIDCSTLPKKEKVTMSFIGAVYYPQRDGKPKSVARNNNHGKNAFDAIILIDESTPTHLLKKSYDN